MRDNLTCMKGISKASTRRQYVVKISHSTHFGMMTVLLLSCLVCLQTAKAGTKVERRGFKSSLLSTARGFGKRASLMDRGVIPTTAIHFGKRSFKANDFPQQLLSLEALPAESQYYPIYQSSFPNQEYDWDSLMRRLNLEASRNPRIISMLEGIIRAESDNNLRAEDHDDSQYMKSNLMHENW